MFTKEEAMALLQKKQRELGRPPKKEDCTAEEVARIKSKLGPWPRALEEAGLKEKRRPSSAPRKKRSLRRQDADASKNVQKSETDKREDKK